MTFGEWSSQKKKKEEEQQKNTADSRQTSKLSFGEWSSQNAANREKEELATALTDMQGITGGRRLSDRYTDEEVAASQPDMTAYQMLLRMAENEDYRQKAPTMGRGAGLRAFQPTVSQDDLTLGGSRFGALPDQDSLTIGRQSSDIEDALRRVWGNNGLYADPSVANYYRTSVGNRDYAEKSQYDSSRYDPNREVFNERNAYWTDTGFADPLYDYINRNPLAVERLQQNAIIDGNAFMGTDNTRLKNMTDDEIALFNYLYASNPDRAYDFVNALTPRLNAEQRKSIETEAAQRASENPIKESVWSVLESPLKGAAVLPAMYADYVDDRKLETDAGYNKILYENAAIRNTVSQMAEDKFGEKGSQYYQTFMSMGDFLLNSAITGGAFIYPAAGALGVGASKAFEALSLGIMGAGAAADTIMQKKDQGYSDDRAAALGILAGAVEVLTERIGYDALFRTGMMGLGAEGIAKYIIRNGLSEGAEEGTADILNWLIDDIADIITQTDESEFKRRVAELHAQGYDINEAAALALTERAEELGKDIEGGLVSGLLMAGGSSAINAYNYSQTGRQISSSPGSTEALIESGMESAPGTQSRQYAEELARRGDGNISNMELGQLYQANVAEENAEARLERYAQQMQEEGSLDNEILDEIAQDEDLLRVLERAANIDMPDRARRSTRRSSIQEAMNRYAGATAETETLASPAEGTTTQEQGVTPPATDAAERARQAVQDYAETLEPLGKHAFVQLFDPEYDSAETYLPQMQQAYNAGKNGVQYDEAAYPDLARPQIEAAYYAGQQAAAAVAQEQTEAYNGTQDMEQTLAEGKPWQVGDYSISMQQTGDGYELTLNNPDGSTVNAGTYNTIEEAYAAAKGMAVANSAERTENNGGEVRDSQRSAGTVLQRSGEQAGRVSETAGRAGEVRRAGTEAAGDQRQNGRQVRQREVNARDITPAAVEGQTVQVLEEARSQADRNAQALARKNGGSVTLFDGGIRIQETRDGVTRTSVARGVFDAGTGDISVQANDRHVTSDNLWRHEYMHKLINQGRVSVDSILELAERYASPDDLREIRTAYDAAFGDLGAEELVCDGADHINQFRALVEDGHTSYAELADRADEVLNSLNRAANELTDNAFTLGGETAQTNENAATESAERYSAQISPEDYQAAAEYAYKRATPVQARLNGMLNDIAAELGIEHQDDPQKSVRSIVSRLNRNERDGKAPGIGALKDLARGHLELNDWEDIPRVLDMLAQKNVPYTTAVKNTDQGYRGFHVTWKDGGIGVELQLTTPEAWKVKLASDAIYDTLREIDQKQLTPEEADNYWKEVQRSRDMWAKVQVPDLTRFATSSSERTSPSMRLPRYTGPEGVTQQPSTSSSTESEPGEYVSRNTRPDSARTYDTSAIKAPPSGSTTTLAQTEGDVNRNEADADGVYYSREIDPEVLSRLEQDEANGDVIHLYRTMEVVTDENGRQALRSPMADTVRRDPNSGKKAENVIYQTPPFGYVNDDGSVSENSWVSADEHPEIAKMKPGQTWQRGKNWASINIGKSTGGNTGVAYNPYNHASNYVLNDQFRGAYERPGLVTVEVIVPRSEEGGAYWAELAKDPTGWADWKSGVVAAELAKSGGEPRRLFLSRWMKVARVLTAEEVADRIINHDLKGTNIKIPANTVNQALRDALMAIDPTIISEPQASNARSYYAYQERNGERYSTQMRIASELEEENEILRQQVETLNRSRDYWRGQTRRTTEATVREADVAKAARSIAKSYETTLDVKDVTARMKALGDYIVQGGESGELSFEEVKSRATAIAADIVNNARGLVDGYDASIYRNVKNALRTKMVISAGDARSISPEWGDWRRSNLGKVNVSINGQGIPVDVAYQELNSEYPWLFPEDITHPADQVIQMVEALESLEPIYENPFSLQMAEAIDYCAGDIMDSLLSEDVRQTAPTFADRQAAKLDSAVAEGRRRLNELRAQKNARIEEIRQQGIKRTQEAVARERARRDEQMKAIKDHYQEIQQRARNRKAESEARSRLLKIAKRLQNKKLPAASKALINSYIGDLDTVAKSMTGKTLQNLNDLRTWYEDQKANDPDFISSPAIEEKLKRLSKRQISDLTIQEVLDLTQSLLNIENQIATERKLIDEQDRRDTYMQGAESIRDIKDSGGSKASGILGTLDTLVTTETLSPVRQLHRMVGYADSSPLYRLTQRLADGQRAAIDYTMRASRLFDRFAQNKKFAEQIAGKKAQEISITGQTANGPVTVKITPAMRISLYLHSLNDQNMRHIAYGGVTVPDMTLLKDGKTSEAYARGTTIRLSKTDVRAIAETMTAEERAFARAIHNYFNGMSQQAINEVSEKLVGYSIAEVEDYFPINTDRSFARGDFDAIKFDGAIEGMGFTKERVNASNPIMLREATDVLTQAIDQHSRYWGLAIPVRNFNKVWGVTQGSYNEDGTRNGFDSSVMQAVRQTWGEAGYGYVEKMMTDIQNPGKKSDNWAKALANVRSAYAGAVLTLNASVAMKQAASYPTAAAVVGWKPLAKAMTSFGRVDLDRIAKYTPLQWYRSQGFSTQELGDMASRDKHLPKVLNWIQGMDLLTTRKLWKAAEYYVRDNNKSLERGTDAYYEAVADVYNQIIEETQPNYTTMQRPQLLRSDNTLMQNLAMFKTQPFQNFNVLYDALGNLAAKQKAYTNATEENRAAAQENLNEARKKAAWAVSSQLVQLAVFAGMTFAWNAFRGKLDKYKDKDDEEELTTESVLKGIGKDMLGGAAGMVPFGSEAWELISSMLFGDKYYGLEAVTPSAISDLLTAGQKAVTSLGQIYEDATSGDKTLDASYWNEQRLKFDSVFDAVSKVLGIPYENVLNLGKAIYRHAAKAVTGNKYEAEYAYLRLTTSTEKGSNDYLDNLYQAYRHDPEAYQAIYSAMIDSGDFTEDKIKTGMESRMKKAQGVTKAEDLDHRYLPPDLQDDYDATLALIQRSPLWDKADEAAQDSAESLLYGLTVGSNASAPKSARSKIADGESVGLDETEYILFYLAKMIADEPTTREDREAAINMVPGLTQKERSYLWTADGGGAKSNPYD